MFLPSEIRSESLLHCRKSRQGSSVRYAELFTIGFLSMPFLIWGAKLPHFSAEFQKNLSPGCFLLALVCSFGLRTELYQHTALIWLSALTRTCRPDFENLVRRCSCKICMSFCTMHRAINRILYLHGESKEGNCQTNT